MLLAIRLIAVFIMSSCSSGEQYKVLTLGSDAYQGPDPEQTSSPHELDGVEGESQSEEQEEEAVTPATWSQVHS